MSEYGILFCMIPVRIRMDRPKFQYSEFSSMIANACLNKQHAAGNSQFCQDRNQQQQRREDNNANSTEYRVQNSLDFQHRSIPSHLFSDIERLQYPSGKKHSYRLI